MKKKQNLKIITFRGSIILSISSELLYQGLHTFYNHCPISTMLAGLVVVLPVVYNCLRDLLHCFLLFATIIYQCLLFVVQPFNLQGLLIGFLTLISTFNMGCYLHVVASYLPFQRLLNGMSFLICSINNANYHFKGLDLLVQSPIYLPSTFASRIETQHKIFKSFNALPLKSHTKYIHIYPFSHILQKY